MDSKAKEPKQGIFLLITLFLCTIALFSGCNQQKAIEKKMADDPVIQSVFSKNEIKDLARIRLMIDKMVIGQTGESDTKTAYEKFISSLGKVETAAEISGKIPLSHDSLVHIIKATPTLQEIWKIWDIKEKTQFTDIDLNYSGKVMVFLKQLSKKNANYNAVLEGIENAGGISPTVVSDFLMIPARYNWESEAEKLYATVIFVILTNKTITRADIYLQRAIKLLQDFNSDSALFWVDKAIAIDSTNLAALRNKAGIMIVTNKHAEALGLYTKCIGIDPEIAEDWKMAGMLNDYLGNTGEAARCYSQATALYNRQQESGNKQKIHVAKVNKAMVMRLNNLENEARQMFEELINQNPADSTIAKLSMRSKQDCLNDLKPYQTHGGYKERPIITIKNTADYSQTFIDEFKKGMIGYKTIHFDKNKIIINGTHIEYFPDFIPIGQKITLQGKNEANQVELEFTRINQTSIRYSFKVESDDAKQLDESGEAHLQSSFFYGDEIMVDNKTNKSYSGHDFIDKQTGTLIKIVEGDDGGLLASISSAQLGKRECPVLSSEK